MAGAIIKVENVSKQYRLGDIGTGALSHDINRWWHKIRGKEDPYLKIGEENNRTVKGNSDYVWALKDINFEVKAGEVLGIIGRNGAGKSTLLKILSRTTTPTVGSIRIKGRVASLLEVGTGFHPELSGRENIFLNGAILGMTKKEIVRKFDEIVAFAGVERYIDTPVKRYSSGMYVRLAFAVAAHLEPEILIVDEVLAVGDAEFQKKCLGKMKDVSNNEGRTVLFVSHNMGAIQDLCKTSILLAKGTVAIQGETDLVLKKYLSNKRHDVYIKNTNTSKTPIYIERAIFDKITPVQINEILIHVEIFSTVVTLVSIDFRVTDSILRPVGFASIGGLDYNGKVKLQPGLNKYSIIIKTGVLALGEYSIGIDITDPNIEYYERIDECLSFEVLKTSNLDRQLTQSWNYGYIEMEAKILC